MLIYGCSTKTLKKTYFVSNRRRTLIFSTRKGKKIVLSRLTPRLVPTNLTFSSLKEPIWLRWKLNEVSEFFFFWLRIGHKLDKILYFHLNLVQTLNWKHLLDSRKSNSEHNVRVHLKAPSPSSPILFFLIVNHPFFSRRKETIFCYLKRNAECSTFKKKEREMFFLWKRKKWNLSHWEKGKDSFSHFPRK